VATTRPADGGATRRAIDVGINTLGAMLQCAVDSSPQWEIARQFRSPQGRCAESTCYRAWSRSV